MIVKHLQQQLFQRMLESGLSLNSMDPGMRRDDELSTNKRFWMLTILQPALLLAMLSMQTLSWAADAGYRSVYTSLEKCDVIESSEQEADAEIDYFTAECPGREGYRILHVGGDSRSWIVIKSGEETVIDLYNDVMRNQPGAFPFVSGKVAEWRYKGEALIALIFRIAGSDLETDKLKSELMVVRFDVKQACMIGVTISNEEAREIADSNKTCLSTAEHAGK